MNYGETISYLRKQKGLTVSELCGDQISRQGYNRFVAGKVVTSINTFVYLLDKLGVDFDEFFLIHNGYQEPVHVEFMYNIKTAFEKKNVQLLNRIINEIQLINPDNENTKLFHISLIGKLLIGRITGEPNQEAAESLKKYLLTVETWTRYEMILFNNCMFAFSSDMIKLLIKKATTNIERFSQIKKYGSESFRMLFNASIHCIISNQLRDLNTYRTLLTNIQLSNDAFYEKFCLKFLNELLTFYYDEEYNEEPMQNLFECLKLFDTDDQYLMFQELFLFVKNRKLEINKQLES